MLKEIDVKQALLAFLDGKSITVLKMQDKSVVDMSDLIGDILSPNIRFLCEESDMETEEKAAEKLDKKTETKDTAAAKYKKLDIPKYRENAIRMFAAGHSAAGVAEKFGCHWQTASRFKKKYEAEIENLKNKMASSTSSDNKNNLTTVPLSPKDLGDIPHSEHALSESMDKEDLKAAERYGKADTIPKDTSAVNAGRFAEKKNKKITFPPDDPKLAYLKEQQNVPDDGKRQCDTCLYGSANKSFGGCAYARMTGKPRGCVAWRCYKYQEKGKETDGNR